MGFTPYRTNARTPSPYRKSARPVEPPSPPPDYWWVLESLLWAIEILAAILS
jgi:hypothetical protein